MKRKALLALGLAYLGIGFDVAAGEREMMQQVANEAGVSIDDVRMVLGSRTQHARYRTSYDRAEAKVKAAMRLIAQREETRHRVIVRAEPTAGETEKPR